MGIGRENRRRKSTGALPALVAAFALVVQLLIPAAAMAWESASGSGPLIVMCTADGAVAVPTADQPDHGKGFGGLKCHDCVMASVAAVGPTAPVAVPVLYAVRVELISSGQDRPHTRVRAPPRPPSTAPPSSLTA